MIRALLTAALLAAACSGVAQESGSQGDAALSSRQDYTRRGARDLPIRCKPGDIEYFAGKTLGEVFGNAWPAPPAAQRATPAHVVDRVAPTWPKGLGQTGAIVIVAVLVGAEGKALDAKAICATAPAIAKPAVRAAMRSRYAPATFDGVAATSVSTGIMRFGVYDAPSTPVPDRPGRDPSPPHPPRP